MYGKYCFAIDRGGTFTDIWARCPQGKTYVLKIISEDPANYSDAPREGIRRILETTSGISHPATEKLDTSQIEWIRMGTTVATNALLERKGERMALAITAGFRDLLHIGNQSRPNIFDLEITCPDVLYEDVVEVEERLVVQLDGCQLHSDARMIEGTNGEQLQEWAALNEAKLRCDLCRVLESGVTSLAVVLMHSYTCPLHEERVGDIARELGFKHISLSSATMPMVRVVPRGFTACADAYLTPCIKKYLTSFCEGFAAMKDSQVLFMQSDGGLTPMHNFNGARAIVSGPAGGVVGYAMTTYARETHLPVIGFDMGGTSTDVSRYAGQYEHVFESTTAGVTIQVPQLDINTVAAGGGSRLFFRTGMFVVGPESAGAHPGPVCYRKGGPLTVTDANLVLGRLRPEYFPKIFGKSEDQPLDSEAAEHAFNELTYEINGFNAAHAESDKEKKKMSVEEVALGFINVANEAMCRPIRALTQAKGHDTANHVLACFGGAGGQHACAIARSLGMQTVFVHRYSGILSAYGLALADVVQENQEPSSVIYGPPSFPLLDARLEALAARCRTQLTSQGFSAASMETEAFLHMRFAGTDCALMVSARKHPPHASSCESGDFEAAFLELYQREFGFTIAGRDIIIDDLRVRGVGRTSLDLGGSVSVATDPPECEAAFDIYFEGGYRSTNVYQLATLGAGHELSGPALIVDANLTILVEPGCTATITDHGDVRISVGYDTRQDDIGIVLDAVRLSIFSHRFMSTAEQMGRVLRRTSISTNIKERLDFSCAVFGPDGGLVANAPHIPVHLGAMQETVQYQLRTVGGQLREGDVLLSNHPCAGGSHLPDLTVITPVFHPGSPSPVFYVANRGHHVDIGGTTPGSMPPNSTSIFEEGAVFRSFFLVKNGVFQEEEVTAALHAPSQHPGCTGTRALHDNLSDLRAQVAANQKGIALVHELINEYGLAVVQAYMLHIQNNAELAVRHMLRDVAEGRASRLQAEDKMDDGSAIRLAVEIDVTAGSAVFDFTGTGYEVHGNCNAPRAVTLSALIYCLRCMVGRDVPLNQGCLAPIHVIVPPGCLLSPSDDAAVVGGNVLTSQRIVDVVFRAFGVCAASQGCMNNITFGDASSGYYETVAGGAGAGPTWHGRSGVHSHMTNTRITDPEILECRYPVVLQQFSLNPGSGGAGQWRGGDGVVRELLFRKPQVLTVLTERRVFAPYGLHGGEAGAVGQNLLQHTDGRITYLGGKTSVNIQPGQVFRLITPGGGGYGAVTSEDEMETSQVGPSDARQGTTQQLQRGSVHAYNMLQESA